MFFLAVETSHFCYRNIPLSMEIRPFYSWKHALLAWLYVPLATEKCPFSHRYKFLQPPGMFPSPTNQFIYKAPRYPSLCISGAGDVIPSPHCNSEWSIPYANPKFSFVKTCTQAIQSAVQRPISMTALYVYLFCLFVTLMFCNAKDLLVRKQLACLKKLPTFTSIYIYTQRHLLMQCCCVPQMKRTVRRETTKIGLVKRRLSEMLFGSLCLTRMYGMLTRLQVGRLGNRGSITSRSKEITRPLVELTQPFYKTALEILSWWVKRLGGKVDKYPVSRMSDATILASPYVFMRRGQL